VQKSSYRDLDTWKKAIAKLEGDLTGIQKKRTGRCLAYAADQLDSARFGLHLLSEQENLTNLLSVTQYRVKFSSTNLVLGSAVTALDLCAAVLYWMNSSTPISQRNPERETDVGDLPIKLKAQGIQLPQDQKDWLDTLSNDPTWELLKKVRNVYTHRTPYFNHLLTVGTAPTTHTVQLRLGNNLYDLHPLLKTVIEFSDEQFIEFCEVVENF
jgi:hypothetical protein